MQAGDNAVELQEKLYDQGFTLIDAEDGSVIVRKGDLSVTVLPGAKDLLTYRNVMLDLQRHGFHS
jgi:hypothetical protein